MSQTRQTKLISFKLPEGISYYEHNQFVAVYSSTTGSNAELAAQNAAKKLHMNPNLPVNVPNFYATYSEFSSQEEIREFLEKRVNELCLKGYKYTVFICETCHYLIRLTGFESEELKEEAADASKWCQALMIKK